MQHIDMILKSPDLTIEKQSICYEEFPDIEYFYVAAGAALNPREQAAYIGSSEQLLPFITTGSFSYPVLFIITDWQEDCWSRISSYSCNLLVIPQEPWHIYNVLNDILGSYRHWFHIFEAMRYQKTSLQLIIEAGARMLEASVLLLNSGYSMVAHQMEEQVDFPGKADLLNKGFLTLEHIIALKESPDILYLPIRRGVSILSFLVVITNEDSNHMMNHYLKLLQNALKSRIPAPSPESALYYRVEFEQLVHDLINMNISTSEEIDQRFQGLFINSKLHFSCMVIKYNSEVDSIRPINPMIAALQKIFPDGLFCIYKHTIVSFLPEAQDTDPAFSFEALQKLLKRWNASAGLSTPTSHRDQFRTFYIMAVKALHFGAIFGNALGNASSIYHYEDYRIYHMVDMCRDGFVDLYHHENLIYMCDPLVIRLYLYDRKHKSNYLTILITYLELNCNLAQSARLLNYHRNTMLKKLDKIESILKISLDNFNLSQSVLFSHKILRYISEYLKKDILSFELAKKDL